MIPQDTTNRIHGILVRIKGFILATSRNNRILKRLAIVNFVYIVIVFLMYQSADISTGFEAFSIKVRIFLFWLLGMTLIIFIVGNGISEMIYRKGFEKIGFKNSVDSYPILIDKYLVSGLMILTFDSSGIAYDAWEDNLLKIENVLNITISEIKTGNRDDEIIVKAYSGKYDWNESIRWSGNYLLDGCNLLIGQSVGGNIILNLDTYAHVLIGGMTGSGKTILLKQLLLQCIAKGYQVYIADFKLGVDYTQTWKEKCTFMTKRMAVISNLRIIVNELDNRLTLFAEHGCKDIDSFNSIIDGELERIIFSCDELTELLDTTGMDKEEKTQIKEIESHISKIARLGRAVGIHLILSTQRPDADILNGQIKSNMTYRLCGRANEVLSRIILDSTDASKLIPKDAKGVFINQDGIRIKGFDIKNEDLGKSLSETF